MADAGEIITKEKAHELEQAGVREATLDVDGVEVKVISNGMVDIADYVSFSQEELEDMGINEKVNFEVLCEILDTCGDDLDSIKNELRARCDDLIPKHITTDDFCINQLPKYLAMDIGTIVC